VNHAQYSVAYVWFELTSIGDCGTSISSTRHVNIAPVRFAPLFTTFPRTVATNCFFTLVAFPPIPPAVECIVATKTSHFIYWQMHNFSSKMTDDFDERLEAGLVRATRWLNRKVTRNTVHQIGCFGRNAQEECYFELKHSSLIGKGLARKTDCRLRGICLLYLRVPVAKRNQGYATRVVKRLKKETKTAGHDFFCADFVISPHMRQIVTNDADYELNHQHNSPSYVATFSNK